MNDLNNEEQFGPDLKFSEMPEKIITVFDTETTGFTKKSVMDPENPGIVQLGLLQFTEKKRMIGALTILVQCGQQSSSGAFGVHQIPDALAGSIGVAENAAVFLFMDFLSKSDVIVAHSISFDLKVMGAAFLRYGGNVDQFNEVLQKVEQFCTMRESTPICQLPKTRGSGYKWPKLGEAMKFFFNEDFVDAHDAFEDTKACARIYFELQERKNQLMPVEYLLLESTA